MIIDTISNMSIYSPISRQMNRVLTFLSDKKTASLKAGRYNIHGEGAYAMIQEFEAKPPEEGLWEAHRKYIDLHYLLKGSEKIGYSPIRDLKISKRYSIKDDYLLLKGHGDFFNLTPGRFAIFFPEDAHMPGLFADSNQKKIKKIVVKIKIV